MRKTLAVISTLAILALIVGFGLLPALRVYWWWSESNPIRRGATTAARVGCLSCHGPEGTTGLPDPNTGVEVPTWDGGVPMMYVSGPDEVREYILDGVSKRRAASASAQAERERSAIRMPAYRDVLNAREVEDLVAYFMAASQMESIADEVASKGRDLVRAHRCESCHGFAGAGGVLNPGSFKGYIPGWRGADYDELVLDEGELRQWILEGGIERFATDRLASYFVSRQRVQMPPYKQVLTAQETDAVVAYLDWVRSKR